MLTEPFPKPLRVQFMIMFCKVFVFCMSEASKLQVSKRPLGFKRISFKVDYWPLKVT